MKTNKLLIWSIVCLVLSAFAWANWDAPSIAKIMGGKEYVLLQLDEQDGTVDESTIKELLEGNNYSYDAESGTIAIVFNPKKISKLELMKQLTSNLNKSFIEVEGNPDAKACPVGAWSVFLSELKDFLCIRQPQLQK